MLVTIFALLASLALAVCAGFFSIIGLTAIFPGAYWSIVVMGSILEFAKLVTASWLYRNWAQTGRLMRAYLCMAVVVIMCITSLGVFGYLSKSHLDQRAESTIGLTEQQEALAVKIKFKEQSLADFDRRIAQVDTAVEEATKRGRSTAAIQLMEKETKRRAELIRQRDGEVTALVELKTEKAKLDGRSARAEAEVGPIKYVAELFSVSGDLERAVRIVIFSIVVVFDPLAVLLLIAAQNGLQSRRKEVRSGVIEVPEDSIHHYVNE